MINSDFFEKNKNKLINFGVIILALFIAFKFYSSANDRINFLIQDQNNELEKNKVVEDIAILEKKAEMYKKVFVKKDLASIMGIISDIAKDTAVKIVSVKPFPDEVFDNHINSVSLVTLNAPSYHTLGDFISKIENYKDIYLVSDIAISSSTANLEALEANTDLTVTLKISTIAYL